MPTMTCSDRNLGSGHPVKVLLVTELVRLQSPPFYHKPIGEIKVEIEIVTETEIYGEIYNRNLPVLLWKPRSTIICYLQEEEPGKPVVQFRLSPQV